MKFRSAPLLLPALLWLGLAFAAVTPASAGPLKSIGSGLKKVGNALTPWKKAEPAPAPAAKPAKAAPKPKTVVKAAPAKPKAKPVAVAQKKKASTSSGSSANSASTASASTKKKTKTAAGATTAAAAGAAGATGPEAPNDSTKDASTPPDTTLAADSLPTSVPASAAPVPLAELPFGTPIMGKKGYVRSPFAPEDGLVDVTGIDAGTKVKCPFSGKVFRVP